MVPKQFRGGHPSGAMLFALAGPGDDDEAGLVVNLFLCLRSLGIFICFHGAHTILRIL